MLVFKMAWRNLWRNGRRTWTTVGAMSLAFFVMVQYAGLVEGYLVGMERNILDMEFGDIQVFPEGYRRAPSIFKRIKDSGATLTALDAAGLPAASRLLGGGLAAAGDASAGVSLRGVDVARDARVSQIHKHVAEGQWLDPSAPTQVVIGRKLARALDVKLGAELLVLAQGADGSMANDLYTVRGILKGISDPVDRGGVFMTTTAFRELMVVETGVHQIIVRRGSKGLDEATAEVKAAAGAGADVRTWRQLTPTLASMIDASRGAMLIMFLIVYMAIGIMILNAMLMAVFERIRELGLLKAVGMGPASVMAMIFVECALQIALALLIGGSLSVPVGIYLATTGIDLSAMGGISVMGIAWDPVWKAAFSSEAVSGPLGTLVFVVFAAALYPAIKAATLHPVRALQHR